MQQAAPTAQEIDQVLQKVLQIASMAGFNVEPHPNARDTLAAGFDMGGGRKQMVFIRYTGTTPDGHNTICFWSPCMQLKKGGLFGHQLGKTQAIDLLRRNSMLAFGAFALINFDSRDLLAVMSSQIVETMEVEEFKTHISFVALAADAYEQEIGKDEF